MMMIRKLNSIGLATTTFVIDVVLWRILREESSNKDKKLMKPSYGIAGYNVVG